MSLSDLLAGQSASTSLKKQQAALYGGGGDTDSEASTSSAGVSVSGRGRVRKVSQRYGDFDTSVELGGNGLMDLGDDDLDRQRARKRVSREKDRSAVRGRDGSAGGGQAGSPSSAPAAELLLPPLGAEVGGAKIEAPAAGVVDLVELSESDGEYGEEEDDEDEEEVEEEEEDGELSVEGSDDSSDFESEEEDVR